MAWQLFITLMAENIIYTVFFMDLGYMVTEKQGIKTNIPAANTVITLGRSLSKVAKQKVKLTN